MSEGVRVGVREGGRVRLKEWGKGGGGVIVHSI